MQNASRIINLTYPSIKGAVMATYLWQNSRVQTDPDTVLTLCKEQNINTIYVQWGGTVTYAQWQYFIGKAHTMGIEIHVTDGDPTWGLTANITTGMVTINSVISYNSDISTSSNQRFDGIHYDVEIYTNAYWASNNQDAQLQWYSAHQQYQQAVKNAGMKYGGAVPYWLDNGTVSDTDLTTITSNTPTQWSKPLWQMFIELFDQIALMSYRNEPVVQETYVQGEIDYATSPKIIVGFEITQQQPSTITYFGQPLLDVKSAVDTVDQYYASNIGYLGCFIHDYKQLEVLVNNNPNSLKTPSRILLPARTVNAI